VNWSVFFSIFIPIVITFSSARLIQQTDIIMISAFGEIARNAYAIPANIMIFDTMIGFALGPVMSLRVGRLKGTSDLKDEVSRSLQFTLCLSIFLVFVGLAIYPFMISLMNISQEIADLATVANRWLVFAIPGRLIQFSSAMMLHGLGQGKKLVAMSAASLAINALLNYILMYGLGLGFEGSYISTFVVTYIACAYAVFYLIRIVRPTNLQALPPIAWIRDVLTKISAELIRLFSGHAAAMTALYLFSIGPLGSTKVGVFAVANALEALIFVPFLATMRTASIYAATHGKGVEPRQLLQPLKRAGLFICVILGTLLFFGRQPLADHLYHFHGDGLRWWMIYGGMFALQLPLSFVNMILKSILQYQGNFVKLSRVDVTICWGVVMPLVLLGNFMDNPWIAWGAYGFMTLFTWVWLNKAVAK
jgi:Na+-driven multidrug efflux pump